MKYYDGCDQTAGPSEDDPAGDPGVQPGALPVLQPAQAVRSQEIFII